MWDFAESFESGWGMSRLNKGAESTLAFLLSLCEMRIARDSISAFERDLD